MADNWIPMSDVKQMTPDRAELREIAEHIAAESVGNIQVLARDWLAIAAPLLVKCESCGGKGYIPDPWPESKTGWDCSTCHGKGFVERADLAAIRKRFEDAAHEPDCKYIVTLFASLSRRPRTVVEPCDCWKSTFGLDALLDLIAAQAREIERLKGKANGTL